jgi:tRNA-dihydrouridine synthase A
VHARKALLAGLSPAENRTVPPLKHEWAYALARDFPECEFHLNGGLKTLNDVKNVLERGPEDGGPIVGAMIGRQAHADPWGLLSAADTTLFGEASNPSASRRDFLNKYAVYADETIGRYGTAKDGYRIPSVRHMMHPIQNLFHGCANNKAWRRLDGSIGTRRDADRDFGRRFGRPTNCCRWRRVRRKSRVGAADARRRVLGAHGVKELTPSRLYKTNI